MASEEPHERWIALLDFTSEQYLWHSGTGEVIAVSGPHAEQSISGFAPFELSFVDGKGALVSKAGGEDIQATWCNDLLSLSLHTGARSGYDGECFYIQEKRGASRWYQNALPTVTSITFAAAANNGRRVVCEVYKHDIPKHEHFPCAMWYTIPYIMTLFYGPDYDRRNSNFVAATTSRWRHTLQNIGLEGADDLIRQSAKSAKSERTSNGKALSAAVLLSNEREFSIHPLGLVLTCISNCVGQRFKSLQLVGSKRMPQILLESILNFTLDAGVTLNADGFVLEVAQGKVNMRAFLESQRVVWPGSSVLFLNGRSDMAIIEVLLEIGAIAFTTKSRCKTFKQRALQLLVAVAKQLYLRVECSKNDGRWKLLSGMDLPALVSKKARRVSFAMKASVSKTVALNKSLRKRGQLLAGIEIAAKRQRLTDDMPSGAVKPKSAQNFSADTCYQYWLGIRSLAEVMPEKNTRGKVAGEAYTEEELQEWGAKSIEFMAMPNDRPEQGRKEKKAITIAKPRTATFTNLRLMENALIVATGDGFEKYDNRADMVDFIFWPQNEHDDDETSLSDSLDPKPSDDRDLERLAALPPPCTLVISADQDGKQWAGFNFIINHLSLNATAMRDPYHRQWNDITLALKRSSYFADYYHTTIIMNCRYGPWTNAGWYRQLQEESLDAAQRLDPDDPILLHFWDSINMDKRSCHDSWLQGLEGRDARRAFLDGLVNDKTVNIKGPKIAPSKWFNYMEAHLEWDRHIHTQAFVQVLLCVEHAWVKNHLELFEPLGEINGSTDDPTTDDPATTTTTTANASAGSSSGAAGVASSSSSSARATADTSASSSAARPAKKTSAYQDAKARYEKLRSKAHNTLHSTTRLLCCPRLWGDSKVIMLVARAEHESYCLNVRSNLKGPTEVAATYKSLAAGEWVQPLGHIFRAFNSLDKLARAGFKIDFSSAAKKRYKLNGYEVIEDDNRSTKMWRLVQHLVRNRVGSLMFHSHFYPGRLAMLLDDDLATTCLTRLRADVESWMAALTCGVPEVQKMARRSPFQQTFLQWCIIFARAGRWKEVLPPLKYMVNTMYRGFGQSRLNEDCNKMYRDAEIRDNASRVLKMLNIWEIPNMSGLLDQYKRKELTPTTQAPPPPQASMDKWFSMGPAVKTTEVGMTARQRKEVENRNQWTQKLKQVIGPQTWLTFDPDSQQNLFAEAALISDLYRTDSWNQAADAWKSRLLPEGELIIDEVGGVAMFVIRAYDCGAICWPAKSGINETYYHDPKVPELVWRFCFDLEVGYKVQPAEIVSPLRSWLKHSTPSGVSIRAVGRPLPLLEWHAENGFPSVPEATLKKIFKERNIQVPPHASLKEYKTELVMVLMKSLRPDMSKEQAVHALRKGHLAENAEHQHQLMVDDEMMRDVIVQKESVEMKSYVKSGAVSRAKFDMHVQSVSERSSAHFKPKSQRGQRSGAGAKPKSAPHWLPAKSAETPAVTAWILKHKPPLGAVEEDSYNGRWRLHYPNQPSRSVSWTQRGHEKASKLCVYHMWQAHTAACGEEAPFPLQGFRCD